MFRGWNTQRVSRGGRGEGVEVTAGVGVTEGVNITVGVEDTKYEMLEHWCASKK